MTESKERSNIDSKIPKIQVKDLFENVVHLGHKSSKWNPMMMPYIHSIKNGIHMIDLNKTLPLLNIALEKIYQCVRDNKKVLFVGSKNQISSVISECAEKCGQFYINHRWLGGILTNWSTVSSSIKKLIEIEKILSQEESANVYTKKELLDFMRKKDKLLKSFAGIRNMNGLPDLVIIIDTNKERLAVQETLKLSIPVIAIVDTNSNPLGIDFPIPGNDDAIKSVKFLCDLFSRAALNGIQDSLIDSGVDIGEDSNVEGNSIVRKDSEKELFGESDFDKAESIVLDENVSEEEVINTQDRVLEKEDIKGKLIK